MPLVCEGCSLRFSALRDTQGAMHTHYCHKCLKMSRAENEVEKERIRVSYFVYLSSTLLKALSSIYRSATIVVSCTKTWLDSYVVSVKKRGSVSYLFLSSI